jgi:hypothetical protein
MFYPNEWLWLSFTSVSMLGCRSGALIGTTTRLSLTDWDGKCDEFVAGPLTNRRYRVALCNMCLTIFAGIKNTPLSAIAGRSYESINVLHRWCGYTTILTTIVHTAYVAIALETREVTNDPQRVRSWVIRNRLCPSPHHPWNHWRRRGWHRYDIHTADSKRLGSTSSL